MSPAMKMTSLVITMLSVAAASVSSAQTVTSAACEQLVQRPLAGGHITSAVVSPAAEGVPASCRVAATLTPTPDSDIKIEVWMPLTGWNGKFHSAGGAAGANSAVGG